MARVSHFTEEFQLSNSTGLNNMAKETATKSQPETRSSSSSYIQKLAEKTKKAISTPIEAVHRLGLYYKNHINQLVATNISSDSDYASSSTTISSYGDEMASEEELMRQTERNHLNYMFYIGPNNSPATQATSKSTTNITTLEEDGEYRCPDVSTLWAEAYVVSENDSYIEQIEQNMSDHLYALGWEYELEKEMLGNQAVNGVIVH